MKDRNVAKQNRDYSCGAASLCTIFQYYWGVNINEQKVLDELDNMLKPQERRDRIKNGLSMADLRRVAVKLGFVSSVANLSIEKLLKIENPRDRSAADRGVQSFRRLPGQRRVLRLPRRSDSWQRPHPIGRVFETVAEERDPDRRPQGT